MWELKLCVCFILLFHNFIDIIDCHIVLTYPPARKYAFDFLDNVQTRGPCGVPKGLGDITNFRAGQRINVTWHVAYPHKGGSKIALLNHREEIIHEFNHTFIGGHDPTKLHQEIILPDKPCHNCTLQITRQAGEWSTNCPPGQYIFWSCADINIYQAPSNNLLRRCGNHPFENGRCQCKGPYSGDMCQYKDECVNNTDCNNGKCIHTESTYFPKKQCYCNAGWFGPKCEKKSSIVGTNIDYSLYTNTTLSPEYQLYHRLLKEESEIEIVMRVKSRTWIGIGWRPSGYRSGCQYFPSLPVIPEPEPEKSTTKPEPSSEPEKTTAKSEPESEPEKTTIKSEPESEPEKTTAKPEPEPEPVQCVHHIVHYCKKDGYMVECYKMQWMFDNKTDVVEFEISAKVDENQWIGIGFSKDDKMVETDIITGWHSSGTTYIQDRYAKSYYGPPPVDGSKDIFNISGSRHDGITQLKFSRKRNTGDDKDVVFTDKDCFHVLFAWGGLADSNTQAIQKHKYKTNNVTDNLCIKACQSPKPEPEPEPEKTTAKSEPESEPEKTTAKPEPESEPVQCVGHIVHYCKKGSGMVECYKMQWMFDNKTDVVEFTIGAIVDENQWIGIGFSKDDKMIETDIITGWHNNGRTYIQDRYAKNYYEPPPVDGSEDIFNISGSRRDGITQLKFSRKRNTGDNQDVVFTDTDCFHVLFAWGGLADSNTQAIQKHKYKTNNVTDNLCIKACHKPKPEPEPEKSTTKPEPEPESEKSTAEPEPNSESTAVPEGEGEPGSCGPPRGINDTTGDNPHDMDCVDMVIGSAKGQFSRIGDYYSRDRSTPQRDEFYGGTDDLSGAVGFEDDAGFTTIIFRKKIKAYERTDHSIIDEPMHVIWARGQDAGNYVHNTLSPSGIEDPNANPSDPNYYKIDELKYHGHVGHRGATSINFFTELPEPGVGECIQQWGSCINGDDNCHQVSWVYNKITDRIHFTLKAKLQYRQWMGIGFSRDKTMLNTDTIIAWIDDNNAVTVVDGWTTVYAMPYEDRTQDDVRGVSGSVENGITTISFHRARDTKDNSDIAFTRNECFYMIFPKGGQYILEGTRRFSKHDIKPKVSQQKICIPCPTGSTPLPVTTPGPFEKFWIRINFIILSIPWSNVYENKRSNEYITLKQDIELLLNLKMNHVRGFISAKVLSLRSGSIRIEAAIEIEEDKSQSKTNVESVLNEVIKTGKLGVYSVDKTPGSFSVGDPEAVGEITPAPPVVDEKVSDVVWIIVGVAAGGLFMFLLLGVCKYIRNKRQRKDSYLDEEYKHLSLGTSSSSNGNSNNGKNGLSVMNMAYEEWRQSNTVPTLKSEQHSYKIASKNNGLESF